MKPKQPILKNFFKDITPPLIRQRLQPKKLQAMCVGAPKTGTTSIANLFSTGYRYEHEGERYPHVTAIFEHFTGKLSDDDYCRYLKQRAHRLWLDLESNCFLGYRIDLVFKTFPEAKYILTIREPFSWLNSIFDNNINFPVSNGYTEKLWHKVFFKPDKFRFSDKEQVLKDNNLYPVDAYLSYWLNANKSVIGAIPKEQLLILHTNQISQSLDKITKFLDISDKTLNKNKSRMNVTEKKFYILDKLDEAFVKQKIHERCDNFYQSLA